MAGRALPNGAVAEPGCRPPRLREQVRRLLGFKGIDFCVLDTWRLGQGDGIAGDVAAAGPRSPKSTVRGRFSQSSSAARPAGADERRGSPHGGCA